MLTQKPGQRQIGSGSRKSPAPFSLLKRVKREPVSLGAVGRHPGFVVRLGRKAVRMRLWPGVALSRRRPHFQRREALRGMCQFGRARTFGCQIKEVGYG
jgi:hypothetical protein